MTEPFWSTTVPLMDPSTVWPITGRAAKNNVARIWIRALNGREFPFAPPAPGSYHSLKLLIPLRTFRAVCLLKTG
jgi:hypothetical protein